MNDLRWTLIERWQSILLNARLRLGRASPTEAAFRELRRALSARFISGDGVEIGALHEPLGVSDRARVRYVDRMSVADLRSHYPELASKPLVPIDILDDGETLRSIGDATVDFVIANHMLEHCEDPLTALETFLRVVRPGGIVYLAIPDKRFTFDAPREVTSLDHVLRDHHEGAQRSRQEHYLEWVRKVVHKPESEVDAECDALMKMQYSIHFHVWTLSGFAALLRFCRKQLRMPFRIESFTPNQFEVIAILRKMAS
jgi:predicted SAM-dependent methyltransferase